MAQSMKVAVIDDELDMRQSISQWLTLSGFEPQAFSNATDALAALDGDFPGVIVTDIRMPGVDGMQFLRKIKGVDSSIPVIMITGHGDVPMAVEAMRLGAFDFLEKPFNPDELTALCKKAVRQRRLVMDSRQLRRELATGDSIIEKLVGDHPSMARMREDILDLGQSDGHVLIEGETGTGKTLVAHALHAVSARAGKKFVLFSCASDSESGVSQRLFGPAEDGQPLPLMEEARGGTLVLEDIEALSQAVQSKLLSAINDLGDIPETRVVAICNLQEAGKTCEDVLRPDLFYRLATLRLLVPPLRSRGDDILVLFSRYCETFSDEYGCDAPKVSAEEAAQLLQAPWPGNVRQLINVAERAVLQSRREGGSIASLLMSNNAEQQVVMTTEGKPLKEYVESFEKMLIDNTMRRHAGSIAAVMDELRLPRRTLNEKMAKYGLVRADYT